MIRNVEGKEWKAFFEPMGASPSMFGWYRSFVFGLQFSSVIWFIFEFDFEKYFVMFQMGIEGTPIRSIKK